MRNPFHSYDDYDYAKAKTDEIFVQMRDRSAVIPYLKNIRNTDVAGVYRRGDCNMNFAKDKGDFSGNPFPTAEYTGEYDTYVRKEKALFRKDGSLIYRQSYNPVYMSEEKMWGYDCYSPIFRPITDDIQTLFELCKDYRQISVGKNHWERQIIVGDFDVDFTDDTIDVLESLCEANNIPHFTYLERHLDSDHYQIGWILDQPLIIKNCYGRFTSEHTVYLSLIKKVSQLFDADPLFRGWWAKNPNCIRLTETFWYNDTVSKDEFITAFDSIEVAHKQKAKKNSESAKAPKKVKESDSRNEYLMNKLRSWIWDYMREKGSKPSLREAYDEGRRIAKEADSLSAKDKNSRFETESVIYSVYRWAVNKFNAFEQMTVPFNVWVCKAKKEIKLLNAYEVFKRHLEEGLCFAANGNLKKSKIVKEVAEVNKEDERSARSHLNWVINTAHLGGVSDRYIMILLGYLLFQQKEGPKIAEYIKMCEEAEERYQKVMEDYIAEQTAMDSVEFNEFGEDFYKEAV